MRKFFAFFLLTILISPSLSFAQFQQFNANQGDGGGANQGNNQRLDQNVDVGGRGGDVIGPGQPGAPEYGLEFERIEIGTDPDPVDGHPRGFSSIDLLTGYAWGGDVAGWLQFNPEISRGFLPPQNVRATPVSQTAIRLDWQNVSAMDDLQLFKTNDNGQFDDFAIETGLQNQQGFVVDQLRPDTNYGFYLYTYKEDPDSGEISAEASTPVVEGRTLRDDGGGNNENNYALWCDQITENSISLNWLRNNDIPDQYVLSLWGAPADQALALIQNNLQPQNTGIFGHQNLEPGTDYAYQLKVDYADNGIEDEFWPENPSVCQTLAAPGGEEDQGGIGSLNVYTISRSSLFLNWADRYRQSRLYDLRRLRITPEQSAITGIETVSESSLRLNFTNATNLSADKTPFKQTIERALPGGNFAAIQNANNPVIDNRPANQNQNYSFTDTGLAEATVYEYKIKTCATTLVDLNRNGQALNDQEICADYSNVFQQATRPLAPANLAARADINNPRRIILSWDDSSAGENGYRLSWLRDDGVASLAEILDPNTVTFIYDNLAPGRYDFTLRAFKNIGEGQVLSESATAEIQVNEQGPPPGGQSRLENGGFLANIFSSLRGAERRGNLAGDRHGLWPRDDKGGWIGMTGRLLNLAWENLAEKTSGFFASVRRLADQSSKKAFALQYQENFNSDYFTGNRRVRAPFSPQEFPAAYQDNNLDAGTVYLYRLELLDAGNNQRLAGSDILYGAGETLPEGPAVPQDVRVCVRNNFCGTVQGEQVGGEFPQNQCQVNGDCRNVGSFYTIIREN